MTVLPGHDWLNIALANIDRVREYDRRAPHEPSRRSSIVDVSDAHSRQYPTSESPFDSNGDVITQFLHSLHCSLDPHNLHFAGRDLSGRFAVTSRSHQAAFVAGQHAPKDWHGTFLRLRMRTAQADQSLRTMLSSSLLSGCSPPRSSPHSYTLGGHPKPANENG